MNTIRTIDFEALTRELVTLYEHNDPESGRKRNKILAILSNCPEVSGSNTSHQSSPLDTFDYMGSDC